MTHSLSNHLKRSTTVECRQWRTRDDHVYHESSLEINSESSHTKNTRAMNEDTKDLDFGSRGGMNRTSANSVSGGQVTLPNGGTRQIMGAQQHIKRRVQKSANIKCELDTRTFSLEFFCRWRAVGWTSAALRLWGSSNQLQAGQHVLKYGRAAQYRHLPGGMHK